MMSSCSVDTHRNLQDYLLGSLWGLGVVGVGGSYAHCHPYTMFESCLIFLTTYVFSLIIIKGKKLYIGT